MACSSVSESNNSGTISSIWSEPAQKTQLFKNQFTFDCKKKKEYNFMFNLMCYFAVS